MRKLSFCDVASVALMVLAMVCSSACGDEDSAADTDCRDLSGQWEVTSHCDSDLLGSSVTIAQNGCDITIVEYDFAGSVSGTGDFSAGGVIDGDVISCEGFASNTRITQTCSGDCSVVLERR